MKVVHLTTVDISLRYLILPQLEAAAEVGESYAMSAPGPYVSEITSRGIRHIALPSSTRGMDLSGDVRTAIQFWRAIKALQPDIVHTHNPKPGVYGRILARLARVPIVVNTVHGLYATPESPPLRRFLVYLLEAIASRFSDAELIQNVEDLDLLRRNRIVPRDKLRLLGNGVDLNRFEPARKGLTRQAERARLGLAPTDVAVGIVSRLVAEKGIPELIEAAKHLPENVKVLVAGPTDPEKGDAVAPQLLQDGNAAGIEFVGMRDDIDVFYSALDIFVLPSHREGFPRAAMEAAATGLPLVVTDVRGCRQVVDDGVNGLLIPVNDPRALTGAISELAASPTLRESMGMASIAKAKAEFDEDRVVDLVMSTYSDVASAKGLSWKFLPEDSSSIEIRRAVKGDEPAIASLHSEMIESGFLSSLGSRFLELLYRSIISDPHGLVFVATSRGGVVGFIAGTTDTKAVYRQFLRQHFLGAVIRLVPAMMRRRTWRRIRETLRYGASNQDVHPELLSMAVAPHQRGRGLGKSLVSTLLDESASLGVDAMRVVVGADNAQAIGLYRASGFTEPRMTEVHSGESSMEMVWRRQG